MSEVARGSDNLPSCTSLEKAILSNPSFQQKQGQVGTGMNMEAAVPSGVGAEETLPEETWISFSPPMKSVRDPGAAAEAPMSLGELS